MKLIVRWIIAIVALAAAVWIVPGIRVEAEGPSIIAFALMAIILGFVNAFIRPILQFLSCGVIILTMGLFLLVINALTLWFSAWLANQFGINFYVDGFWAALFGSIIVSIVSFLLSIFLVDAEN